MDPLILFFLLGFAARLVRSDLRLPEQLYEALSVYLLLAIGLKGGVELAKQPVLALLPDALAVLALGVAIPLVAYPVLRRLGSFGRADAASIAAHYGSCSVVTFAVAHAFLREQEVPFEEHMPFFVVVLEVPALVVGIVLARRGALASVHWGEFAREVLAGKSIVLLVGGLAIGALAGPQGIAPFEGLFFDLFRGLLALFLLEMGLVTASRMPEVRRAGAFLAAFGIVAPLVFGTAGALLAAALGYSAGGTMLLATLAASASYIAAPAAMRMSVPEANPALSLGASLGVTFPFNITLGVPIYLAIARALTA